MSVWMVFVWLFAGSAMRYVLPYLIEGLVRTGKGEKWPKWEWRYLSALALAMIGFGVAAATNEGYVSDLAGNSPEALVGLAFSANQVSRWILKAIGQFTNEEWLQ